MTTKELADAIMIALAAASPAGFRQAVRTVLENKYGPAVVTEEMIDRVIDRLNEESTI